MGKKPTSAILLKQTEILDWWFAFGKSSLISFFETWYDGRDHWTLHFETDLDDLDHHARSQLCEKPKAVHSFSRNFFHLF